MKTDLAPTEPEQTEEVKESERAPMPRTWSGLRRWIVSIVLILVLLAGGVEIFVLLWETRPVAEQTDTAMLPPRVEVRTLVPEDIREIFVGYGSARADREATISAEVSGRIVRVPDSVKDGAAVKAGEVLVRIDDRQYQREFDRAQSQLGDVDAQLARLDVERSNIARLIEIAEQEVKVTEDEYNRLKGLFEENLASKKERDFARLAYQTRLRELRGLENERALIPARKNELVAVRGSRTAEVELAKLNVERCTIRSPFGGQIEEMQVEAGDRLPIGGQIARLVDIRFIEVPVELPLSDRPRIDIGSHCQLSMDSMPGVHWVATVRRLSPMSDTASRTFTAYVEVDNEEQTTPLVPGFFLTARIDGPMIANALVVPRGSILGDHVLVVNDDMAHSRPVRVVSLIGDRAVISGEVASGDRVILTNLDVLYDGAPVRFRKDDESVGSAVDEMIP